MVPISPSASTSTASTRELVAVIERLLVGGIGVTAFALNDAPEAADLTLPQWRVLVITSDHGGVRVGELATRLGVTVPSASRLVRRVERRGLVTAERDERDRRATVVGLTRDGRRVLAAVMRRRRGLIEGSLATSSSFDGGTTAEMVGSMASIADALARYA